MADPTLDLATVAEVQARLPFGMSPEEQREAQGAIEDLSEDARHYGSDRWLGTSAPRQVKNMVVRAAARHMKNYEGFVGSRAGDEAVAWGDKGEGAGTATFTKSERVALAKMAFRGGLATAPMSPWQSKMPTTSDETVPAGDGRQPFPFFAAEDGGW